MNLHAGRCRFYAVLWIFVLLPGSPGAAFDLEGANLQRLEKGEILIWTPEDESADDIQAAIKIDTPPICIWNVLVDCDGAPDYIPGLKACEVLRKGEGEETIRHELSAGWFLPTVTAVFVARYDKPRTIRFHRVGGDIRELEGAWHLRPLPGGASTLLLYQVHMDIRYFIPHWLVVRSLHNKMPLTLEAIRTQARKCRISAEK